MPQKERQIAVIAGAVGRAILNPENADHIAFARRGDINGANRGKRTFKTAGKLNILLLPKPGMEDDAESWSRRQG
jgi:hypothetical protein